MRQILVLLLWTGIGAGYAQTITLYGDTTEHCTSSLRLDTDGVVLHGRTPGVSSTSAPYLVTDCYFLFRTKNKRAIYRINVDTISIPDIFTYIAIYDGDTPSAGLLEFLRQSSQAPPSVLESTGNTVRIHLSTDRGGVYLNQIPFQFRAVISESTPVERCKGYSCYNQSACVAWSLCNDGVDNCYDGSDETDECDGPPPLKAGVVAGIVFGTLAGLAVCAAFIYLILRCYKTRSYTKELEDEDVTRRQTRDLSDPIDTMVYEGPDEDMAEFTPMNFISNGHTHEGFIADERSVNHAHPSTEHVTQSTAEPSRPRPPPHAELERKESEECLPNYRTTNFSREQASVSVDPKDIIMPEPLSLVCN